MSSKKGDDIKAKRKEEGFVSPTKKKGRKGREARSRPVTPDSPEKIVTISTRVDNRTKKEFVALCTEMGLSPGAVLKACIIKTVNERRVPFSIEADRPIQVQVGRSPLDKSFTV